MPDMSPPALAKAPHGAHHIAPDIRGQNFHAIDRQFQDLMSLYTEPELRAAMMPHFDRLGALAGGRLDELATIADKHPPVLQPRDRYGRDEDWIDYHPSYREMEKIAFEQFGMHAMSHRAGVLGMAQPASPLVTYAITYLFVQAEFGLMCPVSVSDTSNFIIKRYGSEALKKLLLDRLLSQNPDVMLKGTQFMTEKAGGSDVGALETEAERVGVGPDGVERWKLYGQKWFCSHADADVAVMLARPRGAAGQPTKQGTSGLGLFALPRRLEDGSRNSYRIVRLKDKLGTRSMASGGAPSPSPRFHDCPGGEAALPRAAPQGGEEAPAGGLAVADIASQRIGDGAVDHATVDVKHLVRGRNAPLAALVGEVDRQVAAGETLGEVVEATPHQDGGAARKAARAGVHGWRDDRVPSQSP